MSWVGRNKANLLRQTTFPFPHLWPFCK